LIVGLLKKIHFAECWYRAAHQ